MDVSEALDSASYSFKDDYHHLLDRIEDAVEALNDVIPVLEKVLDVLEDLPHEKEIKNAEMECEAWLRKWGKYK